jgi:hypothetical protein
MNRYTADQRKNALAAYLGGMGKVGLSEMSKSLKVHRNTLAQWKKEDAWEAKLAETVQLMGKKMTEKFSDELAEEVLKKCERLMVNSANFFVVVDQICFKHLYKCSATGDLILNERGLPSLRYDKPLLDLKRLANIQAEKTKAISSVREVVASLLMPDGETGMKDVLKALDRAAPRIGDMVGTIIRRQRGQEQVTTPAKPDVAELLETETNDSNQ